MSSPKLDLTPVRKKLLLAYKHHAKSVELREEAAKDAKKIIEKSNLIRGLGDYFEEVDADFDTESCEACESYYIVTKVCVTKDTPKEVRERLEDILISALPESTIEVNTTDRTSRKKKSKKEVKSYE